MPRNNLRSYHHGDLKSALVEAAWLHIEDGGWSDLNFRDLARQVGVSHMAPYRHFSEKNDLLAEVAAKGFCMLVEELKAALEEAPKNLRDAISNLFKIYVRFARKHSSIYSLMFAPELADRTKFKNLDEAAQKSSDVFVKFIQERQKIGQVRKLDPRQIRVAALSMTHGTATLLSTGYLSRKEIAALGVETMIDGNIDVLVEGIKTLKT